MNFFKLEINKILGRRLSFLLLVATIIIFPAMVKIISHLNVTKDGIPQGLFTSNVAFGIISFSQLFFFVPIWIILFIGIELSDGHVNRVVFETSRRFYFLSKLIYCTLITAVFSLMGLITLFITLITGPFEDLNFSLGAYGLFFIQLSFSTFVFSIVLFALVMVIKSPVIAFVVYFGWTFSERILYTLIKHTLGIEMTWLPIHLVQTLFIREGEVASKNYYNPFVDDISMIIIPMVFVVLLIIVTYQVFIKTDLKPLSD